MNLKKHIPILFIGLVLTSTALSQQKYPAGMGNANKRTTSLALEMLRKNGIDETETNVRVSDELMKMYREKKSPSTQKNNNSTNPFSNIIVRGNKIRVQVIAASISDVAELEKILVSKGMSNIVSYENILNGDIEVKNIASLEEVTSIMMVKPQYEPSLGSGPVQSQGDKAIRADIARNNFGVNGAGVKIGILSDSYNALGGAAAGVNSGELPGVGNPNGFIKPVVVLKDLSLSQNPRLSDEGRAMAEIVHDVAPGAQIYFYTAFDGVADFANGIRALATAGCKIIVDDVSYLDEPFYQDGILTKAVEDVTRQGVTYFTHATNRASKSYEFNFKPVNFAAAGQPPLILHNFSSDAGNPIDNLPFFCPVGGVGSFVLQWTEPFKSISGGNGARTDLDVFVLDNDFNLLALNTINNIGQDPSSFIFFENTSEVPVLRIVVQKRAGLNTQKIKIVFQQGGTELFSDLQNVPGLFASTITGQCNARSAITVGAADYRKTVEFGSPSNIIESFSSKGGTDILFNKYGGRTLEKRFKPEIVAADNGNTSFFIVDTDGDGIPNFPGTSASAPHAAAVAALCLEASQCFQFSPSYVKSIFILNSADMDDPETPGFDYGFDFKTGYGFINAENILSYFDFCNFNKKSITKNKSVSSLDKKEANEFSIVGLFPNPVTDILNISISGKEPITNTSIVVKILDNTGKQISTTQSAKGKIISINVQSLSAGTYIAQITNNGKVKNLTFLKQ